MFQSSALSAARPTGNVSGMEIVGHGIDLVECARIASVLDNHRDRFLARILTPTERDAASRFKDDVPHIAGRFAAKEAVLKVLGTGWRGQISWHDIEVVNNPAGRPLVTLRGHCAKIAESLGMTTIQLSITHTRDHAAASAIGLADSAR